MQPFAKAPASLARAAKRARKSAGIESQETDAAGSDHALRSVDPADGRGRGQRVEIVHDHDEPIEGGSRRGGLSDSRAKRGEEFARRARRGMVRFQKFRSGGPHGGYASGAFARGFGALRRRVRFGRQRGDPLIEASGAGVEVATAVADLAREQPPTAQQKVREAKRAP